MSLQRGPLRSVDICLCEYRRTNKSDVACEISCKGQAHIRSQGVTSSAMEDALALDGELLPSLRARLFCFPKVTVKLGRCAQAHSILS